MTTQVRVLADPLQLTRVCDACFDETTTIGLRYQIVDRFILQRRELVLDLEGDSIGVKAVRRGEGVTLKAAADDLAAAPGGQTGRETLRRRAAQGYRNSGETG